MDSDIARLHFIVQSVLIGTMDVEALVDALEIIDGMQVSGNDQTDVEVCVVEADSETGEV